MRTKACLGLSATVTTPGVLGNVTNWQQHVMPTRLYGPFAESSSAAYKRANSTSNGSSFV